MFLQVFSFRFRCNFDIEMVFAAIIGMLFFYQFIHLIVMVLKNIVSKILSKMRVNFKSGANIAEWILKW